MAGVALVAHHERDSARGHALAAATWCQANHREFWMPPLDARALDLVEYGQDRSLADADLVLSLGGDGTMLRSVRLLDGAAVPVLGVNLGSLGYLTEVEPEALESSLASIFAAFGPEGVDRPEQSDTGEWHLDRRMMLDVFVNGTHIGRALNEAVIEKSESGHTVRLLARIDGEPFTHYAADGLIVATPTGSTAYSLSARGPIISPQHRAVLLTPVSPHMLFDRSLVLDPSEVVEIEVSGHRRAEVALDGNHTATINEGDVVRCTPAPECASFIRFGAYRYHQILKAKFGLADR